jgi:glycosyltransferase involved in cell wall biosynthesis
MRIGIDARELQGRPTGVGRYIAELLGAWLGSAGPHEFHLYAPGEDGPLVSGPEPHAALTVHMTGDSTGTRWEQWTLPRALRRDDVQVLFAPAYSAPVWSPCPVGLTMHDVSFCAHPEWFSWREGLRRRWLARRCARRAAALLTVSEFSAAEIVRWLGIPRDRIHVVLNGVDHIHRRPAPDVRWLTRHTAPHVISVGSVFNRRHAPALIQAFARAFTGVPGARLSIAGENRTFPRLDLNALAVTAGVAAQTTVIDYASPATVDALFDDADLAVFVSEYEGFGLPMLEALARGVPVVVADTEVSHEVCGAAATFVPPGNVTALASALDALRKERNLLAEQLRASGAVLDRYRWGRTAAETLTHLLKVGRQA